jgi:hypothetical protein
VIRRSLPVLALAALALAGCGGSTPTTAGVSASLGAKSIPAIQPPPYIPGPLDGQSTPRKLALRRPLAVIVENYNPDSRPQAGLSAASTVIETLAEGGVTRFMAIYLEHDAAKVGPVRSTRIYFDHWASAFHAILSHVGGNDDAQALLWHLPKVFNIDENRWEKSLFNTGTPLFWRAADREAPHNLYTSTITLRRYAARNHENWVYTQANLPHKAPAAIAHRGHFKTVSIAFANPLGSAADPGYAVVYRYNRQTNTYLRFMGGAPHIDALSKQQIHPANVIVMRTADAVPDPAAGITPESITIPMIGTGRAIYLRDGTVQTGIWKQANADAPLHFLDRRGRPVAFNPGQTWIEVAPKSTAVSWSLH